MANARITLPPPGMNTHLRVNPVCVQTGGHLEVDIKQNGFVAFLPFGQFARDLPFGPVLPGVTEHTAGPNEIDIVLGYVDATTKVPYPVVIRIRKNCLDTSGALE